MITQWIQVGMDAVAVDDQKGLCGVLIWLDNEILVPSKKVPQIGVQEVETPCPMKRTS